MRRLVFNEMILNSLSWFFIRSTSQCSEGINFDWLNGWKCWTLAKTFAWRRVKQDSRNGGHLNGFNRKADKNEGTLVSGSKKTKKLYS